MRSMLERRSRCSDRVRCLRRRFSLDWKGSHHCLRRSSENQSLGREMEQLQGRLFVWIIILLQITLTHFGMDFTFRFVWLHP
ncbi:uncharacterized protein IUM83_08380 [Phytophthora cinnamomi]|uniref:uncharacterized protein n=1 Tax=Phytophthora cinnamomi TaxID=4785 RepID=UPI003559E702|nr:hypothetical protein IUM83_08380 [Phytophthora cinnamomi]